MGDIEFNQLVHYTWIFESTTKVDRHRIEQHKVEWPNVENTSSDKTSICLIFFSWFCLVSIFSFKHHLILNKRHFDNWTQIYLYLADIQLGSLVRSKDFFRRGSQTGSVGWYIYSNIYKYMYSNFVEEGTCPRCPPLATRLGSHETVGILANRVLTETCMCAHALACQRKRVNSHKYAQLSNACDQSKARTLFSV